MSRLYSTLMQILEPRRSAALVLMALVGALVVSVPGFAHIADPTTERGFSPNQVFQFNNLDSVNLFNGNLSVALPIGPVYQVGGELSYQLQLVYNSKIWDYEYDFVCGVSSVGTHINGDVWSSLGLLDLVLYSSPDGNGDPDCFTIAIPNRKSNAGTGWTLGFGQLYPPRESGGTSNGLHGAMSVNDFPGWLYVSPDGSEHKFYESLHGEQPAAAGARFYTRDGSFIRLDQTSSSHAQLHMPNGQVQTFEKHEHLIGGVPGPETHWRLIEMKDPFDNRVSITYPSDLVWEITDSSNTFRKHTIDFIDKAFSGDPAFGETIRKERIVKSVTLAGYGGTFSSYEFKYGPLKDSPDVAASATLKRGCPNSWDGDGLTTAEKYTRMLQLTEIKQPDGTPFEFQYTSDESGAGALCSWNGGRLKRMTLPTGGGVEYEYGPFVSSRQRCLDLTQKPKDANLPVFPSLITGRGVVARREALTRQDLDNTAAGVKTVYVRYFGGDWNYSPPFNRAECDLPKTGVTAVLEPPLSDSPMSRQRVTLNYFSIYQTGLEWNTVTGMEDPGFDAIPWDRHDYGLPFTRESSAFGDGLPEEVQDPADPDRLISREVYDCLVRDVPLGDPTDPDAAPFAGIDLSGCDLERQVFVKYEQDPASIGGVCADSMNFGPCFDLDRRLVEEMTYFLDDTICEVAGTPNQRCWHGVLRRDYDGLGHFRTTELVSGYTPDRSVWTNYNPGSVFPQSFTSTVDLGSFQPPSTWILDTFSERTTSQINANTSYEFFDFDAATGFLKKHERLRGSGLGSLVTSYASEPADKGSVTWERYSGGDDGNLATDVDYVIHHDYQNGVLQASEYRDPAAEATAVLRFVDRDIDAATGLVTTSRDSAGTATSFSYDSMWRLASVTPADPADAETTYQYHPPASPNGARVTVTTHHPNGGTGSSYCLPYDTMPADGLTQQEYEYDGLGRLIYSRTWMPDGMIAEVATVYTPQGWVDRRTTPYDACGGHNQGAPATRTAFDIFGRPSITWAPDYEVTGAKTDFDYMGDRREIRYRRGLGADGSLSAKTSRTYDPQGNLTTVTDAIDGRWEYKYDQGDRLVEVRHLRPPGEQDPAAPQQQAATRRTFVYDRTGLLLHETHPELAGITLYHGGYDAGGNAGTLRYGTAGSSFDLDFDYDTAGRRVRVTQSTTLRPLLAEYFYGAHGSGPGAGKLLASKRHNYLNGRDVVVRRSNFYYAPSGRLSHQWLTTGGERNVPRAFFETAYSYDPLGNVVGIDYPDCTAFWCFQTSDLGVRFRDKSVSPLRAASYAFRNGLLRDVSTFDSTGFRTLGSLAYHHDGLLASIGHSNGAADSIVDDPKAMGRPSSMSAFGPGGSFWSSGTYQYDGAGNIRKLGTSDIFDYDLVNRVTSADLQFNGTSHAQSYSYDSLGNLVAVNGEAFFSNPDTNRISVWTYDTAGNVVQTGGDYTYLWDALGALSQATQTSGTPDHQHLYDAGGERVAVLYRSGLATARELWSLRGADNRVLRDFEYLPKTGTTGGWRWLKDYVHRGSGLLASFDGSGLGERHYHLDHLGTTRAISDASGYLVSRHKYLPFGEEIDVPTDITTERVRFTGQERDDLGPAGQLSDLDYMHARYYRPSAGRFLSLDPATRRTALEAPGLFNRYSYALLNPVQVVDPTGEDPLEPGLTLALTEAAWRLSDFFGGIINGARKEIGPVPSNPGLYENPSSPSGAVGEGVGRFLATHDEVMEVSITVDTGAGSGFTFGASSVNGSDSYVFAGPGYSVSALPGSVSFTYGFVGNYQGPGSYSGFFTSVTSGAPVGITAAWNPLDPNSPSAIGFTFTTDVGAFSTYGTYYVPRELYDAVRGPRLTGGVF